MIGYNWVSILSISHLGNSFNSLPLSSGEARLRAHADIAPVADKAPLADIAPRPSTKTANTDSVFRPIPSFDDLPASLRNALQTYLTIEQTAEPASYDGSELLAGIDTFV
ncbi:MAG: hypothetical protein P8J42_04815 [Pseudomonadales bacterium]|nr:hypothetical protein [Pseudomonadales bacterium]